MCEVRDHDGSRMGGRVRFAPGEGELLMEITREERFVADDRDRGDRCDAADFDFFCRHGDGPWEALDFPPPPGKVVVVPAGSTIRAVPKDPDYVIPEPDPPKLVLGGMV